MVYHYTAGGPLESCVKWFQKKDGVSAHFVVGRDGQVVQMVKLCDRAWHAGRSAWRGVEEINHFSVGIEICNWGILKKKSDNYYCWPKDYSVIFNGDKPYKDKTGGYWESYPDKQIKSVTEITKSILKHFPTIALDDIVGHEHIAPGRKPDPGPAFPWDAVKSELKKWLDGGASVDDTQELKPSEIKEDTKQTVIEDREDFNLDDEEFINQIKKKSSDRKGSNPWLKDIFSSILNFLFKHIKKN
ncbi:N-acetylmuramoyl-L-alanine amidase [Patescibacteria group bacterium]|nr:N-acetylmuramoyl-L-alanine amidase [Patescibacteria group bacterium]